MRDIIAQIAIINQVGRIVPFWYIETDEEIRRNTEDITKQWGQYVRREAIKNRMEERDRVLRELDRANLLMQAIRKNMPPYAKSLIEPPAGFKPSSDSFMEAQDLDALRKVSRLPAIQAVLELKTAKMQTALDLTEEQPQSETV